MDFLHIAKAEVVNYQEYSKLALDKIDYYRNLVFPRMVYFQGGFRSHLDLINYFKHGLFFDQASFPQRRTLASIWNLPSLNSAHLKRYLSQYGIDSACINHFDAEWDEFCKLYDESKEPPLIGLSTTFFLSYAPIKRVVKQIRARFPDAEIVLGGAFVNEQFVNGPLDAFEKPMRNCGINYILYAFNSEEDLRDLILARKSGKVDQGQNLVYIEGHDLKTGRFKKTATRWKDPVLTYDARPQEKKTDVVVGKTVQLRTSVGCPFSCAFCSYPKTAKMFTQMELDAFKRDLDYYCTTLNVKNIIFIDDTFNVPQERFEKMCALFCQYDFEWFSFLRVQYVDDRIARGMKDSGCKAVYLGLESASDVILKNMNKKATAAQYRAGIAALQRQGITVMAAFIIGYPGETDQTIQEDIDFIEGMQLDFYTLKEFYFMKHTSIYDRREEFGLTGLGASWAHQTMTSQQASDKKIAMFQKIEKSIFVDPDTSLWYIACLYDQGFTMEKIAQLQREINAVMRSQLNGDFDDRHPSFKKLKNLLTN